MGLAEIEGLISGGRQFPGARVVESELHPYLTELASEHSRHQAEVQQQGHQGWDRRFELLQQRLGPGEFSEICAESWDRQADDPLDELGYEMFKCWRQSPGHWSVASRRYPYFGASMSQGRNRIWYATIIVGDF